VLISIIIRIGERAISEIMTPSFFAGDSRRQRSRTLSYQAPRSAATTVASGPGIATAPAITSSQRSGKGPHPGAPCHHVRHREVSCRRLRHHQRLRCVLERLPERRAAAVAAPVQTLLPCRLHRYLVEHAHLLPCMPA
jgi:hypothetical protein